MAMLKVSVLGGDFDSEDRGGLAIGLPGTIVLLIRIYSGCDQAFL